MINAVAHSIMSEALFELVKETISKIENYETRTLPARTLWYDTVDKQTVLQFKLVYISY